MRAKFGSDPTAGSKILSFKFISRFILFYMIIIIISVAVALAAMFSLSDSLLTIAFS